MSSNPQQALRQQTLALAAVVQAVTLVDQIAASGQAEPEAFEATINSLFSFSANSSEQAYNGVVKLELGLTNLRDMLSGNDYGDRSKLMRYALGALHLQNTLRKDPDTSRIISNRIQHSQKAKEINGNNINELCTSLSAIYQDTISTYRYRIQITGSAQQLQEPHNAARIRALLLAAVRAAFLWRQAGGNRWRLLLHRGAIFSCAKSLLHTEIGR